MKPKLKIKLAMDMCMAILYLLLMAYSLIGEDLHERIGTAMLVLAIAHNLLNLNWYRNLFKGEYSPVRIFQIILNIAALLCIIGLAISGVMLSRYVFDFVPGNGGSALVRTLHMLCSYWGFVFMSVHAGTHMNMMAATLRKRIGIEKTLQRRLSMLRVSGLVICAYGACAFVKRDIASYLFLKTHFAFFDLSEPMVFFFVDYTAIMILLFCAGHYLIWTIRKPAA